MPACGHCSRSKEEIERPLLYGKQHNGIATMETKSTVLSHVVQVTETMGVNNLYEVQYNHHNCIESTKIIPHVISMSNTN